MIPGIQELIHRFEVGEGTRHVRLVAVILGLLALTVVYDLREYKNFSTQEAMDMAQLGRNISEGKGYTTDFIRPLSIYLLQRVQGEDSRVLNEPHPDLANPPVYPLLLSGLMKVFPFRFDVPKGVQFWRHQPEFLIAMFNQGLFFVAVFLVYRLALRWFDRSVAWVSALIFAGTNVFWRFSVSGLSTMLLVVIFLGIAWCLAELEEQNRTGTKPNAWFLGMAIATGVLAGLGGLTRYSFGWMLLPILGFLALFLGQRRTLVIAAALGAFVVVVGPWIARNYSLSGTPFGTAGYVLYQDTPLLQGNRLERFLTKEFEADLSRVESSDLLRKLLINSRSIVEADLPNLAGNWASVFFLAGLLLPFRNTGLNRSRVFALLSLGVLAVVQALGKTHLSAESPEINSENLLVLAAPLAFIFGVAMYFILLDQVNLPFPQLRSAVTAAFCLCACSPLILTLLPPRSIPIVYHPYAPPDNFDISLIRYYPPTIRQISEWMKEDELIMSDMPWAVAWYGDRRCVWVTLDAPADAKRAITSDFFRINDYQRPVYALYLTTMTSDARFHSQMARDKNYDWGRFMVESLAKHNVPEGFPLKKAHPSFLESGQLFLSDRVRW
ncbi:MAG: glycosyltransferase family 39 protein [Verrucomicrobia bacterium]|nr:glycosyltransferase family 39 protein [Verrucomicrobiota bacterium]